MPTFEHINYEDVLRDGTDKLNKAIDGAKQGYDTSVIAKDTADASKNQSTITQKQLDAIILENGNSEPEVVQARGNYDLLYKRFDAADSHMSDIGVNVKNFGALGGTNNDSSATNQAVDFAIANGYSTIFIPFNEITFGTSIDFKELIIKGSGTIINGAIKNFKKITGVIIDGIDQDKKQHGDLGSLSGSVTTKIVQRVNDNRYHVYCKKPFIDEYLDMRFEKGIASGASDSAGDPAELLRLTGVHNLTKAYVQNNKPTSQLGDWEVFDVNLDDASAHPGAANAPLHFMRYNTAGTDTAWIQFRAFADDSGEISLGFYLTPGSSESVSILVGGVQIATTNLQGDNDFVIKKFTCNQRGVVTVRIQKTGTGFVYVTSNLYRLHEALIGADYSNVAFFNDGNNYISNAGAVDYAMVDEDGTYWGSYHGGESFVTGAFLADSRGFSTLSDGVLACKSVRIDQTTQIGDLFETRSSMRINRDGFFDFDFSMVGDATLLTLYTTMTTTDNTFTYVTYPRLIRTGQDGEYLFGKINRIVQENIQTRQKITTLFTQYDDDNNNRGGVFVRVTEGAYNKVYYGPIVGGLRRIREISGSTTRIFE